MENNHFDLNAKRRMLYKKKENKEATKTIFNIIFFFNDSIRHCFFLYKKQYKYNNS